MKIKALTGIETSHHVVEDGEYGIPIVRAIPVALKEGDVVELDDKLAKRLIEHGHVSEDLEAETNLERVRREASQQQG